VKGKTDKLQKEAYVAAGLKQTTVNTKPGETAPQQHAEDASGRHGSEAREVSEVITDANSGHYIYVSSVRTRYAGDGGAGNPEDVIEPALPAMPCRATRRMWT